MIKAIVYEIDFDREGGIIDRNTIQGCVKLLDPDQLESSLSQTVAPFWTSLSEALFSATKQYYQDKASCWISELTIGSYCQLVESSVAEEMALCEDVFPQKIANKTMLTVQDVLILQRAKEMRSTCAEEESDDLESGRWGTGTTNRLLDLMDNLSLSS